MGLEWETPLYQQALTQFEHALEFAEIPDFVANRLRAPERAVILTLPVKMDDGTEEEHKSVKAGPELKNMIQFILAQ